jgi:biopolymer transport protein ExbD
MKSRMNLSNDSEYGIDLSPMIDMVFLLLIFFMVSTTFVKDKQVDIQRPNAGSSKSSSSESIRIIINKQQDIFLNQQKINVWSLQSHLRDLKAQKKDVSVLLVSDKSVPVNKVVEIVDQTRLAGIYDIGIATEGDVSL